MTASKIESARKLLDSGMPPREVAQILGVSVPTLYPLVARLWLSAGNPRSTGKALTGPLGGLWRYRVGDCRVICDIQDGALRVLVVQLGNRREVYR